MISKLISCVLLFSCLCAAEKANGRLKILVHMSSIGFSHMQFQGKIADELANAGHEVHVLIQEVDPRIANYTGSKKATRVFWNRRPANKLEDAFLIKAAKSPFEGYNGIFIDSGWSFLIGMFAEICEELLTNTELFNHLKGEKYDVVISELYGGCTFGYLHAIGGRVTIATSAAPLTNQPICNKAFGPSFPSLREIIKNVSLLFVNSNEFLTHPRPISSKIIHIGGILQPTSTDIIEEKHVKEILDNSKNGVILVSFGTSADASKMSMKMRKGFVEAFKQFPTYDFIWKYESSGQNQSDAKLLATAPNIHTVKWVEQRAILAHPKLKVFITHGGMNSINEAAHAGKPMVVIPLFNDQLYNAALVKAKGIGEHVEIRSTTNPQFLIDTLSKVLNDPSYSKNVQVLRRKLELTPFSSAERLVKWVEFAAQFPGQLTELNLPNTDELGCATKVMKQEKIMNLIETVRRYPYLYDKGHEDFKDAVKKNARWLEIGKELELNDPAIKWRSLKDQYVKNRKRPSTGSTPSRKWLYFDEMCFLEKTLNGSELRDSTGQDYLENEDDIFQHQPRSSSAETLLKQDNRKRKHSNLEPVQSPDKLDEFLDRAMQPASGIEIFGKFVASELNSLSPVNQTLAKQSIIQLLTQFKLKELAPQTQI